MDAIIKAYARRIMRGEITLENVPARIRDAVAQAVADMGGEE